MKRIGRNVAASVAVTLMALSTVAPANAVVDENGRVVAIIITEDGTVYY